jgi:TPR repeat protein
VLLLWTLSAAMALHLADADSASGAAGPNHRAVTYSDLRKSLELGCSGGNQGFCYELAKLLRRGLGGPADPDRARDLLKEACKKAFVRACAAQPR